MNLTEPGTPTVVEAFEGKMSSRAKLKFSSERSQRLKVCKFSLKEKKSAVRKSSLSKALSPSAKVMARLPETNGDMQAVSDSHDSMQDASLGSIPEEVVLHAKSQSASKRVDFTQSDSDKENRPLRDVSLTKQVE